MTRTIPRTNTLTGAEFQDLMVKFTTGESTPQELRDASNHIETYIEPVARHYFRLVYDHAWYHANLHAFRNCVPVEWDEEEARQEARYAERGCAQLKKQRPHRR